MSELIYLVTAIVLSVVGSIVFWLRHRQPQTMESGINEFARELRALAPDHQRSSNGIDKRNLRNGRT